MDKVEMIITNSESGDFEEMYCDFVCLKDVSKDDMLLIMKYAFSSGYNVYLRQSKEAE